MVYYHLYYKKNKGARALYAYCILNILVGLFKLTMSIINLAEYTDNRIDISYYQTIAVLCYIIDITLCIYSVVLHSGIKGNGVSAWLLGAINICLIPLLSFTYGMAFDTYISYNVIYVNIMFEYILLVITPLVIMGWVLARLDKFTIEYTQNFCCKSYSSSYYGSRNSYGNSGSSHYGGSSFSGGGHGGGGMF